MGLIKDHWIQERNDYLDTIHFLEAHKDIDGVPEVIENLKTSFILMFGNKAAPWIK